MSDLYYSNNVLNQTIDLVTKGLRDLNNSSLAPFYDQPDPVTSVYADASFEEVLAEMEAADLSAPSKPDFSRQLEQKSGNQLFIEFLRDCGFVLAEETEDLVTQQEPKLPNMGDITAFVLRMIDEKDIEVDSELMDSIASSVSVPMTPTMTQHIVIVSPSIYGELDPIVSRRLARIREYMRSYFR